MKAINWILIYVYDFFWYIMIISDFTGISLIKRNKNLHCSALLLIIWLHYCIDCYKIQSNFMKKYRREKWILEAKKRDCCKTFCLVSALMENQKKCLEGIIYGNPALQSGGWSKHDQESRLEDGTWGTVAIKAGSVFQTSAVLQTDGLPRPPPPALKGGVTANVALRAGRGFATAPFFVIDR